MTVIFSKKCEYGLRAVLYLSAKGKDVVVSADEISKKLRIPREFISKILQNLTKFKLIKSRKGNMGGFSLAKEPSKIRLLDIVKAIDGLKVFESCVLGFPKCSPSNPCPVHKKWGKLREDAYNMLIEENLEDFKMKTIRKINL